MEGIIGIFGGAFDPIHKGHVEAIRHINNLNLVQEIQIIPNYQSPHNKNIQIHESHRLKMIELAFKKSKNIFINDFETKNKKTSFTLDTLLHLKNLEKRKHLTLIIGFDSLCNFTLWNEWKEILSLCSLLVVGRTTSKKDKVDDRLLNRIIDYKEELFLENGKIYLLENDLVNISSSEVRNKIKMGESISDLVSHEVEDYISKKSLYKN